MLKSAPKQEKDPEGRMPLAEHLRELRNRLMKSVLAIIVVTIVASFFYRDIIQFFMHPVLKSVGCVDGAIKQANGKPCAEMTVNGLTGPFAIAMKVSLMAGLVAATPIWLYQLWAFLAPGLHTKEKRYAIAFVGAGVPLFLGGGYLAYVILPQTAQIMIDLTVEDARNLFPLDDYLDLVVRMIIVFGLAFELPLLLVLLNFTGVLTAKRMLGWWRVMVLGITIFAAVATPTGDPFSMSLLAAPIVFLYFGAVGIAYFNDLRKRRRRESDPDFSLDDDEASSLDHIPEQVGAAPAPAASDRPSDDFDDAT